MTDFERIAQRIQKNNADFRSRSVTTASRIADFFLDDTPDRLKSYVDELERSGRQSVDSAEVSGSAGETQPVD